MLELTLCSMLTILPDFLFRRFVQGKRFGTRDQSFQRLVRIALGDHRLPDPDDLADHHGFLFPSLHHQRRFAFPHGSDPCGRHWTCRRGQCDHGTGSESGNAVVPAGQHRAGGCARNRPQADRRGRGQHCGEADRACLRRWQDPGGAQRAPAGDRRTRNQVGIVQARFGHCQQARHRTAAKRGRWPARFARRRDCLQAKHRGQPQHAVAGAKGERRSKPCTGAGGTRQDDRLCRRRRQGRAICIAHGRHRQSDQPGCRRADPEGGWNAWR